jgi:cyclopropane-fatty-acyl-phospholipid synthase
VSTSNGRLDYIETMSRWGQTASRLTLPKVVAATKLIPRLVRERDMRYRLRAIWNSSNQECFKRGLMDHERITLARTADRASESVA